MRGWHAILVGICLLPVWLLSVWLPIRLLSVWLLTVWLLPIRLLAIALLRWIWLHSHRRGSLARSTDISILVLCAMLRITATHLAL